ncbi:hypothetical protein GCK72_019566 [Caenorhabditis remanei]|uniref:G-protein coupled receptors family 1 profile domain-containing protein n=1 Tax=Caenorhabditis remanei TaxID=31234 RepID=A0A6A5GD72_CAERE|nr:hypothetical protein GCK72_019566 [Caenorhabditis remanei]KAF1753010.1 hypothetical protein GCK72_019566 [Caenorhabditis remanei]
MMTSSVFSILIGVAVFDLVVLVETIITSANDNLFFEREGTDCAPPVTHFALSLSWKTLVLCDLVRRSSVWLAIMMALIRLLVLKFPGNHMIQGMSNPSFGFKSVIATFLLSCPFSTFFYFRYDIVVLGEWKPKEFCENINLDSTFPIVDQRLSSLFTSFDGLLGKTYMFANGTVTKIIPCIMLPVLTFLLVLELRKAEKSRKHLSFTKRSTTERTTGLVLFMAISFFVLELPMGFVYIVQVEHTDLGFM